MNPYQLLQKYYDPRSALYHLLITHSEQVRDKALDIAEKHPELQACKSFISEAAMLHDIGVFLCNAPEIFCHGNHEYIEHGYLGSELLVSEGYFRHALVCERHTGTGFSLEKIADNSLPLPHRDMRPVSIEEQIICYADKFYSKTNLGHEHDLQTIRQELALFGADNIIAFDRWHQLFG